MLAGIHFILTYTCNLECDHCFLYCSPEAKGTFTIDQVSRILEEAKEMSTVEWIFYEGGEPLLFFPLLNESIKRANRKGFKIGVVTNAYTAVSEEDARLCLTPLIDSGLSSISISNDTFHYGENTQNPATYAEKMAKQFGIPSSQICIEPPKIMRNESIADGKGLPVVGGGAKLRGRAVDTLIHGLPVRPWKDFVECPYENLETPSRVHIDPYGNVHICQGVSIGNVWDTPLSDIILNYRSVDHPICGPLVKGGPAELAKVLGFNPMAGYVDECHLCYLVRKEYIDQFPEYLSPKQVYGLD